MTSYRGMQYIMVLYDLDSNAVLVERLRNKTSGEIVAAYQIFVDRLKSAGFEPKMHILDNEISAGYKEAIRKNGMKYQLVPPNDHRRNSPEKTIQVFKDHFIAVLCGTDINFPCVSGAGYYHKQSSSSICYASQGWAPPSPVLRCYVDLMTSMPIHGRPLAVKRKSTSLQASAKLGKNTPKQVSTLGIRGTTTTAMKCGSKTQNTQGWARQSSSNTNT